MHLGEPDSLFVSTPLPKPCMSIDGQGEARGRVGYKDLYREIARRQEWVSLGFRLDYLDITVRMCAEFFSVYHPARLHMHYLLPEEADVLRVVTDQ